MKQAALNKESLLTLLVSHKKNITGFGVKQMGLFGSFVRNEEDEQSDVDLLVDFEPDKYKYRNFIGLAYYLEGLINRKVEIVTRSGLSPYIGPKILQEVENIPL